MRRTPFRFLFPAVLAAALVLPVVSSAQTRGARIAQVVELTPPAQVKHAGAPASEPLVKGAELRLGDALRTGAGGRIKISFDDRSVLILAENSRIEITRHVFDPSAHQRDSLFKLYEGKVRAIVGELFGAASEYRIESPTGVAGVKGTDFEEHYARPCTTVYSHKGPVDARNTDPKVKGEVTVRDEEFTLICEGKSPTSPQKATDALKGQLIVLRADETTHPSDLTDQMGGDGSSAQEQEGETRFGDKNPPTDDEGPPRYPTDIINQPTDTGGLPPGTIPEPAPPKNP